MRLRVDRIVAAGLDTSTMIGVWLLFFLAAATIATGLIGMIAVL